MAKTKTGKRKPAALKMIGESDFRGLVKQCEILKNRSGKATSEMGGLISNAVENKHLDKKAFSIFRALKKLGDSDPQKLGTTLTCLDYYRDIGGLDKIVEDNPTLDIERQETKDDNVVKMPQAAE